jgi:hypothetical protein
MDAKLRYEQAKAQLKLEKKLRKEHSGHRQRQKMLKEELEQVKKAVKMEKQVMKAERIQKKKRTSIPIWLTTLSVLGTMWSKSGSAGIKKQP